MLPKIGFTNMYGLCIAIGILLAYITLYYTFKHLKIDKKYYDKIFNISIVSIVIGFFFGFLMQALYNYIDNPNEGFNLFGGITFLGGLLGGCITFLTIYFIHYRNNIRNGINDLVKALPCIVISICIAHSFGRIGCFCAGCCYGIETTSSFGIAFPGMATKVYPTQLFEALFLFLMAVVLLLFVIYKKHNYNLELYLMGYGTFRYLIEFIRGDNRGVFINEMSPSQFWSIILLIIGIIIALSKNLRRKSSV